MNKLRVHYSLELAERICKEIMAGSTLVETLKQPGMPSQMAVWRWRRDRPDFAEMFENARDFQAEVMDHMIMECAAMTDSENYNAMRAKMWAYMWRAERLAPKRYAATTVKGAGRDGTVVIQVTKEDEALR